MKKENESGDHGLLLFDEKPSGEWEGRWIDRNEIAPEAIAVHDLDRNGTLDLVAVGADTQNLVIYWNDTHREDLEDRTRLLPRSGIRP